MKLLKYLAVIIFILFILVNVLTRLPMVQDRIMMSALNNAVMMPPQSFLMMHYLHLYVVLDLHWPHQELHRHAF